MTNQQALFSRAATGGSDLWMTPLWLLRAIEAELRVEIARDVACDSASNVVTRLGRDGAQSLCVDWSRNGLVESWGAPGLIAFCNPPYSELSAWVAKYLSHAERPDCVWVVPARTDTEWWHSLIGAGANVYMLRGRVNFEPPDGVGSSAATFPTVVVHCHPVHTNTFTCVDWRGYRPSPIQPNPDQESLL
jgi:phage N-6-adenine-methyltransferase